jgi:hypothetical protein
MDVGGSHYREKESLTKWFNTDLRIYKHSFGISAAISLSNIRDILVSKAEVLMSEMFKIWDFTPSSSSKDRRFGGSYRLHYQGNKNGRTRKFSNNLQAKHAISIYSQRASVASYC